MRPFALADQWGTDRMQTLRLFPTRPEPGPDLSWEVSQLPHNQSQL